MGMINVYFGVMVSGSVGVVIGIMGFFIGRGNLGLIHDYHTRNVKECDRLAYGKLFAKGLFAVAGSNLLGALGIYLGFPWILGVMLATGGILGLYIINKAQKRYNGGWFS